MNYQTSFKINGIFLDWAWSPLAQKDAIANGVANGGGQKSLMRVKVFGLQSFHLGTNCFCHIFMVVNCSLVKYTVREVTMVLRYLPVIATDCDTNIEEELFMCLFVMFFSVFIVLFSVIYPLWIFYCYYRLVYFCVIFSI